VVKGGEEGTIALEYEQLGYMEVGMREGRRVHQMVSVIEV
jgi:hypothetical protein